MALTVTVDSVNITAYVDAFSISIDEVATGSIVGTCRFTVFDQTGTVAIAAKDAVSIVDTGTTIFAGEVVDKDEANDGIGKQWVVNCQDNNILLDETVVESESYAAGEADSDIIDDLFTTYRSDVDSTTYVSTLDASMEAVSFAGMTLREILEDLAQRTGARYYVDYDKNLHWFDTEVNAAAFALSTEPDDSSSYAYGGFHRVESAGRLANKVFVLGKEVSGWVEDAASIVTYGERHAVSRDQRITTAQGVTDRATAILDRYDLPRDTYELFTHKSGLVAGMSINVINSVYGLDDTFYIRKLRTEIMSADGSEKRYHLSLNDEAPGATTRQRSVELRVTTLETTVNVIDDTVFDTDAPAAPSFVGGNLSTGVDIDADGHQIVYIQVTWGSVADADLSYYTVQGSTSADFSGYTMTRNHPAGGDRIERFVGILGGTTYYWRVRAVDWVGNTSAWSDTQNIESDADSDAPGQVAGLSAASSRTLIGLSWTANSEADLKEYIIERAPDDGGGSGVYAEIARAQLNFYIDQDFSDAQIAAEDTFWYRVSAIDTSGNTGTASAEASATIGRVTTDHIAAATITADNIAANTITANKMDVSELSAIAADLGTITAGTVTGATIRTAAAGARVVLDSTNGIQVYNAAAAQTVSILTTGAGWIGTAASIAWNTAGGVTIDGGLLVDGTIVATAFSNAIGTPLFSAADGVLLFGPYCALTPTSWTSSRSHAATIAGAFHTVQSAWSGVGPALLVEGAVTNYVINPVFETNITDGWSNTGSGTAIRNTAQHLFGSAACRISAGDIMWSTGAGIYSLANGASATVSVHVYRLYSGAEVTLTLWDGTSGTSRGTATTSMVGAWERLSVSWTNDTGVAADVRVKIEHTAGATNAWLDGAQLEVAAAASSLCYGALDWCAWSGAADNSTSTRTATTITLDDHSYVVGGNPTWSCRIVCHVPYAASDDWMQQYNVLWDARGADNNSRVAVRYNTATPAMELYINGSARCSAGSLTFVAGEWIDVVATLDFTNNVFSLYVNGELGEADTTSLSAPGMTTWNLGANYADTQYPNVAIAEYAVFDSVLTADEVAALYITNAALVDAGAFDKSGIYIQDGRFRLYSSTTGARTEIDVDGIKAYSSSAQSVAIDTDGDAKFGSDISAAATTALAVFATAQTYNSESVGAGDVLFGDNTAAKANMLWDVSDGKLLFRGGTTTQVFINTDGSFQAGGGAIKISSAANILFSVASANQGLSWFSDSGFSTVAGYINVATSTGIMTIATGGVAWGTPPDLRIDLVDSGGTETAMYFDSSDKQIDVWGATGASVAIRNNGDGDWPALYVQQVSNDRSVAHFDQDHATAPIIRLDGYTGAAGDLVSYFKVQINNDERMVPYYQTA